MEDYTINDLIDALDGVTWYNGLAEILQEWKALEPGENGTLRFPYDVRCDDQLELIWMICVGMFGDYGTSPRFGWIENVEGFRNFIDDITKTEREHKEIYAAD